MRASIVNALTLHCGVIRLRLALCNLIGIYGPCCSFMKLTLFLRTQWQGNSKGIKRRGEVPAMCTRICVVRIQFSEIFGERATEACLELPD